MQNTPPDPTATDRPNRQQFAAGLWWTGITVAIQCTLALILFFGSKGLANLWHRVQIARYTRIPESKQT